MKLAGNKNLRLLEYGMSIVLLMTWLRMRLRVKEAMCGLARITMEMCRVIS